MLADAIINGNSGVIRFKELLFACDDITALACFDTGKQGKRFVKCAQDYQRVADLVVIFNQGTQIDRGEHNHTEHNYDRQAKTEIGEIASSDLFHVMLLTAECHFVVNQSASATDYNSVGKK